MLGKLRPGGVFFLGVDAGLIVQGLLAFEVIRFDFPSWEKRIVEKRLGRKL